MLNFSVKFVPASLLGAKFNIDSRGWGKLVEEIRDSPFDGFKGKMVSYHHGSNGKTTDVGVW